MSKMKVCGAYFCRKVMRKFSRKDLPLPDFPRIVVCARSP